ncbi:MAG: hypothetical protein ABIH88_03270 [Patescibacteria group bacterium]|nr:hypothetical protein [Patescibacteria group bacterium]
MNGKHKLAKLVSILLIGAGLYNIAYSSYLLTVVYPKLKITYDSAGLSLQEGMVEKAFVHYISLIVNGFYGIGLMFKPREKLTYIQVFGGIILFSLTTLFVIKSPVTGNPLLESLTDLVFSNR